MPGEGKQEETKETQGPGRPLGPMRNKAIRVDPPDRRRTTERHVRGLGIGESALSAPDGITGASRTRLEGKAQGHETKGAGDRPLGHRERRHDDERSIEGQHVGGCL